jgi:hypothetical protein
MWKRSSVLSNWRLLLMCSISSVSLIVLYVCPVITLINTCSGM